MIVKWLDFSDLHFQYNNFSTDNLRVALLKFLKKEEINVDFVLLTGVIFYKGCINENAIKEAADFLHEMMSACSCSKRNLYMVPGNHDLERSDARNATLTNYTGIDYKTGEHKDSPKEIDKHAYTKLCRDDFDAYNKLYEVVTGKKRSEVHQLFDEKNYRVLCIDTCILAGSDYDEGNLSVNDLGISRCCEKIENDDKINIAIMHHGVNYLRKTEIDEFEHLLEDNNIDIVFTGHSHQIGCLKYNSTKANINQLTCGAPIKDSYSSPSFYYCMYDTESKQVSCKLYEYSNNHRWEVGSGKLRLFDHGLFTFEPERLAKLKRSKTEERNPVISETYINLQENSYNQFGIVQALRMKDFIKLRNTLINEASGNIVLAGQSLENAFDIRKDAESIVECIKHNKNIINIDIFLTDPIVFDSSTNIEVVNGDTPINRIATTMHTILYDIAESLSENQSINIYFIPLVQLDHMVFSNNLLLLRHTLLWDSENNYKVTPLVCKDISKEPEIDAEIVKSSMYYVYSEYINKLKEVSIDIDIKKKGELRKKETLARACNREWRGKLYSLRQSNKLKGNIVMHKLYRTQLISDLHSSWDARFGSFSNQVNWGDGEEENIFYSGQNDGIEKIDDLYNPANLLNDSTQRILLPYVKNTEKTLINLLHKYDKTATARIFPSLDMGIPNNILRLAGGFATGMLLVWKCGTPIVPVDTTVNVCSSSYYEFDAGRYRGRRVAEFFNVDKINQLINVGSKEAGLAFSFNTGNHFLLLCKSRETNTYYLVLHSSAKQYKDTYLGLYPKPGNWYSDLIKTYTDKETNRYIRYLKDSEAEKFISIARILNEQNKDIHKWFATKFCEDVYFLKQKTYHHYGMPTDYSIAIGTYVIDEDDLVPIFSREGCPIHLFRPDNRMWGIELEGKTKYIVPHGWGQCLNFDYFNKISSDEELSKCHLEVEGSQLKLVNRDNIIMETFNTNHEARFHEKMVSVRKLDDSDTWERSKYLSGTIEAVLEPVALFSKSVNGVKYYGENGELPIFS